MYILGVSSLAHDPAAVLIGEDGVVAGIEEGKLLRTRDYRGIPRRAIEFCLAKAQIHWDDVVKIAIASRPLRKWAQQAIARGRGTISSPIPTGYYESNSGAEFAQSLAGLDVAAARKLKRLVLPFEHAMSHAASAFFASPFDRALILTFDERGGGRCGLLAEGQGVRIRELRSVFFPNSPAWIYSRVTEWLGFQHRAGEHKTQWLGLAGEPVYHSLFVEMMRQRRDLWPRSNARFFRRASSERSVFSELFYRRLGIGRASRELTGDQTRANIAASLLQACSSIVAELLESLRRQYNAKFLCLAGGLFLNPLLVADVERKTGFDKVFVQPAAGNEGTALGAAWLALHQNHRTLRCAPLSRLDWGPSYSNDEVKQVLDNCKAAYHWLETDDRKIDEAIRLLNAGKIVAWFQGAAEFGPRALGNRSLLASPWAEYVKENLNDYVKHRESFRPFALSVTEEDCARYFDCTPAGRFMATMGFVRSEHHELFRKFVLPGGLLRLHIVQQAANPLLWRLLKRFGETAPAPVILNTSFNLFGEPLVITPRHAVRSYFCSGTDALIAGNFLLSKA